jgi:hypothetical protein
MGEFKLMRGFWETVLENFERDAVWEKGQVVAGENPDVLRKDAYGSVMLLEKYGDCSSRFGWEIDHITSVALGGSDALENKQPLQWENNRRKGDGIPRLIPLFRKRG